MYNIYKKKTKVDMMNEKEILSSLYRNMFGTDKGSEIKKMFESDIKKAKTIPSIWNIYKKYEVYITFGRALGTIKNVVNDFKKIINTTDGLKHKEVMLEAFSLPEGYYYAVNASSSRVVEERKQTNNIELSLSDFDKLKNKLYDEGMDAKLSFYTKALGSRQTPEIIRAYRLSAYLALVTGRRLTEILKTMSLTKYKESVKIKGVLKKGDEEQDAQELIILDDVQKVMNAYRELRKIFDTTSLTNRECNNKYNNIFNNFFKKEVIKDKTFHEARAIYGEIAFEKFGKNVDNKDKKDFIESALLQESKIRAVDYYLNRVTIK